jgi:pimeloyl-ACP methyl ester carboxylesterase
MVTSATEEGKAEVAEPRKINCTVDVSGLGISGCDSVQLDLFVPHHPGDAPVIWCCVPGGGMSRAYFDLDVPSEFGEFSMARAAAGRGVVVLTIDPPGVGGSDVPDDGYELTPRVAAAVLDAVTTEMIGRLASGSIPDVDPISCGPTVGVGHSAGGLLVSCQQAHHGSYDALVILGFSDTGLEQVLNDAERAVIGRPDKLLGALPDLVRERFGEPLPQRPGVDLDPRPSDGLADANLAVKAAGERAAGRLLGLVGLMTIIPFSMKPELDEIDVPVFAAMGEYDIAGDIGLLVGQLPACTDLTLFRLLGVGHNHNESGSRLHLWDRMLRWSEALTRRSVPAG